MAALLTIGTMTAYAVLGPTGLYAWGDYGQALVRKTSELERLRAQHAELANRAELLRPGAVDPDIVDELVRGRLGVAHPDDVIVPLDR